MLGDQHQLVRFSIKPRHVERITHSQRLMSRFQVRCSQRPPLSLWAGWVLERILSCHSFFKKYFYLLIFREEVRERERNINLLFHLQMCRCSTFIVLLTLNGCFLNVPWQEMEPEALTVRRMLSPTELPSQGLMPLIFIPWLYYLSHLIVCLWLFFPLSKIHFLLILTVSILVPITLLAWIRKNSTMYVSLRENRSSLHKLHHLPHLFEYNCADGWNRWELTLNKRGSGWGSFYL